MKLCVMKDCTDMVELPDILLNNGLCNECMAAAFNELESKPHYFESEEESV